MVNYLDDSKTFAMFFYYSLVARTACLYHLHQRCRPYRSNNNWLDRLVDTGNTLRSNDILIALLIKIVNDWCKCK